jgi:hypothetical protein
MSAKTMPAREAMARALYERRGLIQQCSLACTDHFEHDSSVEAEACKADAEAAYGALKAAGYGLWTTYDEPDQDVW